MGAATVCIVETQAQNATMAENLSGLDLIVDRSFSAYAGRDKAGIPKLVERDDNVTGD